MEKKRRREIHLSSVDDIFSTEEERQEEKLAKIRDIPISEIDDFPDHPYKVRDDEDMQNLIESVSTRGVITPATVRLKEDGRYELISGHRRKHACETLGMDTLRCEVVDMSHDEAVILMVESNFQRSVILPSEKAFAYKMRLEAMKRLPGRPSKENGAPVEHHLSGVKTRDIVAEESGESHEQVRRHIRLTNLVPELLEMVDEGKIKMRPAVELSYLDEDSQRDLVDSIDSTVATPSHAQAIKMRRFFENDKLSTEVIESIMSEEKGNQKEKFVLRADKIRPLIPKSLPMNKTEEYVIKALEHYAKYRSAQSRDDDSR